MSSCEACAADKHFASTGAMACVLCDVGTFAVAESDACSVVGASSCHACPAGTFGSDTGCTACAEGIYSATGATSCAPFFIPGTSFSELYAIACARCTTYDGMPSCPASGEDNGKILSLCSRFGYKICFLGKVDSAVEGSFVCADGSNSHYSSWNSSEPSNVGG